MKKPRSLEVGDALRASRDTQAIAAANARMRGESLDHTVTFHYDPGTPRKYLVHGAPDRREAQRAALLENGYHPGVLISSRERRPEDKFDYEVSWRPLTELELEMIRITD